MPRRLRSSLAPALCLAATISLAQDAPRAPKLDVESYRLPNGLKVALHRDPAVPRVTVCIAYHVGSKNERPGRTGFAHFFEHMMFRGTTHVPNYDLPLQEAGAESNAFTNEDMTVYFETVPSNFLERALYLEAERLGFLPTALDQEKFDTEREVVKNERRLRYENVPYGLADETLLATVFPVGHPYSWSVIGSMRDLGNATLDDLKRFFADFYHPANATLCLVGDFEPGEAKRLIQTYFGPLKPGPEPAKVLAPEAPKADRRITQIDDVKLPRVYLSWPTVADDHPDAPALDLLASILAGGDASRLHVALVLDRQVASDVGADSDTKEVAGLFTVDATAAVGKEIVEVEKALDDVLARLREEPPTADELARALAKVEKANYAQMTAPLGRAVVLALGFSQKDDPEYYRQDFERYFRVTPDELARVARQYLTAERVVLEIRPGKEESQAVQAGPRGDGKEAMAEPIVRTPEGGPDWSRMPGPSEPRPFRTPGFTRRRLSNGVDLWVAEWHTLPIVQVQLLVPGGTSDDPEGKSGLASLTASLLDKGTESKSATELAEAFDALGASLGVGVGLDDTSVGFSTLARNLDPALALLGEVLTSPRFDPRDFDREKRLQLTALLRGPDSVSWIAGRAFRALLYGQEHPYGNPTDGFVETVEKLTIDDVREFHRDRVVPEGAILIVTGDVRPESVADRLEAALGGWKGGGEPRREVGTPKIRAEPGVVYLVDKPGAVQSVLSVGRRWHGRKDPRYFATMLGNRILGGDFSSRINQNLRERNGFTYGAGSYFLFRRSGSVWAVQSSVRADATAPALREVLRELDRLAGDKPFTTEEIATAVDAETRSFPDAFQSPSSLAGILTELARYDLPPDYLETFLENLQETTAEDIVKVMTEVVEPRERVVLIVGDRESIEPKLRELGFREIRRVTPDGRPAAE